MKKIIYITRANEHIVFNLNWFEYFIVKRVFIRSKREYISQEIRGQKFNMMVVDESIEFKNGSKLNNIKSKEKIKGYNSTKFKGGKKWQKNLN